MGRERDGGSSGEEETLQVALLNDAEIKLGFFWNEIPPVVHAKLLPLVLCFLFELG